MLSSFQHAVQTIRLVDHLHDAFAILLHTVTVVYSCAVYPFKFGCVVLVGGTGLGAFSYFQFRTPYTAAALHARR